MMSCLSYFTLPFFILAMRVACFMAFSAYLCHEDCGIEHENNCCLKFYKLYVADRDKANHVRETRQLNNHALSSSEENWNIERQLHPMQPGFRTFLKNGYPVGSKLLRLLERNSIRPRATSYNPWKFAELKHSKYGPTPAFDPQTFLEDLSGKTLQNLKPSSFDPKTQKFASLKHKKLKPKPPFHIPSKPQPMPPFITPTYPPQSTNNVPSHPQVEGKDMDDIPRFYLHFSLHEGGLVTHQKQR